MHTAAAIEIEAPARVASVRSLQLIQNQEMRLRERARETAKAVEM
jgi:hypothetical protein